MHEQLAEEKAAQERDGEREVILEILLEQEQRHRQRLLTAGERHRDLPGPVEPQAHARATGPRERRAAARRRAGSDPGNTPGTRTATPAASFDCRRTPPRFAGAGRTPSPCSSTARRIRRR